MKNRPLLWAFAAVLCGEVMAYLFPGRWSAVLAAAAVIAASWRAGVSYDARRKRTAEKRSCVRQGKRSLLLPFFFAALVLAGAGRMTAALEPDPLSVQAEAAAGQACFWNCPGSFGMCVHPLRTDGR